MTVSESPADCPCGSGSGYAGCCAPHHAGVACVTAVALMRSRYSAFAIGLPGYLLASWHPTTRPASLELDQHTRWRRLQIVDSDAGREDDDRGTVHFRASFRSGDGPGLLEERSRFVRDEGRWVYLDGEVVPRA